MKIFIQKYSKLLTFQEIPENKIISENENEIFVGKYKFIKNNTFNNFLKFRSKPLFVSLLILLFTSYSMIMLNAATNSWIKNNGIITLSICLFYVVLFFIFLKNLHKDKNNKLINYSMFTGIVYLVISSIFQFNIIELFFTGKTLITQLVLYNYFYVFIFNATFYFLIGIFEEDFQKMKMKNLNYYNCENLLLVREN
jgi:hypothetical protein